MPWEPASFVRRRGTRYRRISLQELIYDRKRFCRFSKTATVRVHRRLSCHLDFSSTHPMGTSDGGGGALRAIFHGSHQTVRSAGGVLVGILGWHLGYFLCSGGPSISAPWWILGGGFAVRRHPAICRRSFSCGAAEGSSDRWRMASPVNGIAC